MSVGETLSSPRNGTAIKIHSGSQNEVNAFKDRYETFDDEVIVDYPYSTLYAAHDFELGQDVTVESLKHDATLEQSQALERKAKFQRTVTHQHLVKVNDFNPSDTMLVLDPIAGRVDSEKLRAADAEAVLRTGLSALGEVHKRGKLHGNLSADSFLRGTDGIIKLHNAMAFEPSDPILLEDRSCLVAPEMVDTDKGEIGFGSDLFCLSLAVMEVVFGSAVSLLYNDNPRRWACSPQEFPSKLIKKLPSHLQPIFVQLLDKDVEQRFASVEEVFAALVQPISGTKTSEGEGANDIRVDSCPHNESKQRPAVANLFDQGVDLGWLKQQLMRPTVLLSVFVVASALIVFGAGSQNRNSSTIQKLAIRVHVEDPNDRPWVHVDSLGTPKMPVWTLNSDMANVLDAELNVPEGIVNVHLETTGGRKTTTELVKFSDGRMHRKDVAGIWKPAADTRVEFTIKGRAEQAIVVTANSADSSRTGRPRIQIVGLPFAEWKIDPTTSEREIIKEWPEQIRAGYGEVKLQGSRAFPVRGREFIVRANMDLHVPYESDKFVVKDAEREHPFQVPSLQELVELTVMSLAESAPKSVNIDGVEVIGEQKNDLIWYTTEVKPAKNTTLIAMRPGYQEHKEEFDTKLPRKERISKTLKLTPEVVTAPVERKPTGSRYEIKAEDKASGDELELALRIDGQPVLGDQGRRTTPFFVYIEPNYHKVELIDPTTKALMAKPMNVLFADQLNKTFRVRRSQTQ